MNYELSSSDFAPSRGIGNRCFPILYQYRFASIDLGIDIHPIRIKARIVHRRWTSTAGVLKYWTCLIDRNLVETFKVSNKEENSDFRKLRIVSCFYFEFYDTLYHRLWDRNGPWEFQQMAVRVSCFSLLLNVLDKYI